MKSCPKGMSVAGRNAIQRRAAGHHPIYKGVEVVGLKVIGSDEAISGEAFGLQWKGPGLAASQVPRPLLPPRRPALGKRARPLPAAGHGGDEGPPAPDPWAADLVLDRLRRKDQAKRMEGEDTTQSPV